MALYNENSRNVTVCDSAGNPTYSISSVIGYEFMPFSTEAAFLRLQDTGNLRCDVLDHGRNEHRMLWKDLQPSYEVDKDYSARIFLRPHSMQKEGNV